MTESHFWHLGFALWIEDKRKSFLSGVNDN